MILKRLFTKYELDIKNVIFKEYKRLSLTKEEAWFLIEILKLNLKAFTRKALENKEEIEKDKIDKYMDALYRKGFFTIELILDSKGKEKEVLNFDKTYEKIEKLVMQDEKDEQLKEHQSNIEEVIKKLETMFQRSISANEIEIIKTWYKDKKYTQQDILSIIDIVSKRNNPSIYIIEKELSLITKEVKPVKIDPEKEREIMKIFRAIKK